MVERGYIFVTVGNTLVTLVFRYLEKETSCNIVDVD
jgi:hypothetical protein